MFTSYTLDQLTLFLAVVEEGSFSAAGRRLGRVQSAVSYGIQQLEGALDARLFDRRGRTPVLTEDGKRLAAEARLVLAQARELTETAARLREDIEPELRVSVDVLYPEAALVHACAVFQERFPTTILRLDRGLLGDTVTAVAEGWADFSVSNLAGGTPPELSAAHLGTVRLVPVCAVDHALAGIPGPHSGEELERHTQIVHSESWGSETADQGVLGTRTWRVTDLALKRGLILEGVGWGSLPESMARAGVEEGALVELEPEPWPPGGHRLLLHVVVRREHALGPAGQWLREALRLEG